MASIAAVSIVAALLLCGTARAESLRYCDAPARLGAAEQDRLLRVAAILRELLADAGTPAALVSRSGQDLARFGQRYSHAGVALAAQAGLPWAVRQLYFACDEGQPRLFDQGLAGFVMGTENPALGFVSVVLLPGEAAQALATRAADNAQALRLLGPRYSANAYAWGLDYQNCNQWLAELLAAAWGDAQARAPAQAWLKSQGFEPTVFDVGAWIVLVPFIPWVHAGDHPLPDREAARFRVAMPASIEDFVRRTVAGAERIELCHDARQAVVRRGWAPIADACRAEPGDRVIALQ